MELHLVVPIEESLKKPGDEQLNGRWWHVEGPISTRDVQNRVFHCISYVWGSGRVKPGSFFNCQIEISDQTKPALEAGIRAIEALAKGSKTSQPPAFWIDAICVPQEDRPARYSTLESMGYIYSAAESVVTVLQEPAWKVISSIAPSTNSPDALSAEEMTTLELDKWVSSVWTYQEVINSPQIWFTTASPDNAGVAIPSDSLFNCIGYTLEQWKRNGNRPAVDMLSHFPNLSAMEDTFAHNQVTGYLDLPIFAVLSNMAQRRFDTVFPKNRLLASLGVISKEVSWGAPSTTLPELSKKLISTCEARNDYSFIYTLDERDTTPGQRWKPNPAQKEPSSPKAVHLVPIITFYSWAHPFGETQRGRRDSVGFWLEGMILLRGAPLGDPAKKFIDSKLYGFQNPPEGPTDGLLLAAERGQADLKDAVYKALTIIGFSGSSSYQVCDSGLFFPQKSLDGKDDIKLFAASAIRWSFGAPGLARWRDGDDFSYTTGVFVGVVEKDKAQALLMV